MTCNAPQMVYVFPDAKELKKCMLNHPALNDRSYQKQGLTETAAYLASQYFAEKEFKLEQIEAHARFVAEDLKYDAKKIGLLTIRLERALLSCFKEVHRQCSGKCK